MSAGNGSAGARAGSAGGIAAAGGAPSAAGPMLDDGNAPTSALPDIMFTMDVKVPAGGEQLKCLYAAMPADRGVIAVPGAESHYTPGSHHFLAYRSDLIGVPAGQSAVFDCRDSAFLHNKGSYYEAQQPDSKRDLPDGVAHKFQPSEVVILQTHYVNTTAAEVDAHVQFILHTMDPALVQHEAGSILWSDGNLNLAPHTQTRVTMTCPIPMDFNPALLWSHMHHRGSNFVVTSDNPTVAAAGPLYTEADWAEPQPREFPNSPPLTLPAGSHITFSCDFNNETDNTITYGQSAVTNEMCILHGMYWPRNTANGAESCRGGTTTRTQL